MKKGNKILKLVQFFCFLCVIVLGLLTIISTNGNGPSPNDNGPPIHKNNINLPKTLLIYYGWPNGINDAHLKAEPIATAAAEFGKYDYVVLGAGIEEITHPAHEATVQIIAHENAQNSLFFGYIDLGVSTNNYNITEIETKVEEWVDTGVDGIFFDDFGYDFLVTRTRQNEAVAYVHTKGIPVIANAWDPNDVFSSQCEPNFNPNCIAPLLNSSDFYLYESYQIISGDYDTKEHWREKINKLNEYKNTFKFRILSVTTNGTYDKDKFFYAWYSGLLDEIEALGWGEDLFSIDGIAPYRSRPDFNCASYFITNIIEDSDQFYRETEKGQIRINTNTHEFGCFND